jgi:hypothetical protein
MTKHTKHPMLMRHGCERCETIGPVVFELSRAFSDGDGAKAVMIMRGMIARTCKDLPRSRRRKLRLVKG